MWSQTGKFGPWVQIPWGCPTIIVKKAEKKIINQCEWYHQVGKEIKSVANYANFLPQQPAPEDNSETGTVDPSEAENVEDAWKEALQSGEDYQPPESTTPKGGIARCLLKKIQTISETKTVQCFFKGLADGDTPPVGWTQGLPQKDGEDLKIADILDCKYMLSAHQHGKVCFQTIQQAAHKSKVWTACEDFIDYFPSAHWYGKCITKCGDAFKNNFGNFAYNHRLHRGWGQIGDDWINQHEDDEGHDEESTPNGRVNNVSKVVTRDTKYLNENLGMSHKSPWREVVTRGELQVIDEEDVQSATEVKIFKWNAADLGPKSYPFCQLQMWYDWETCDTVPAADKEACGTACHEKHQQFRNKFDEFTKNSYSISTFRAAQENYEKVLHKLNRWEGDRTRLRKSISQLSSEITTVSGLSGLANSDPVLLESLTNEKQDLTQALAAVTGKLRAEMAAWKDQSRSYLDSEGFVPCDEVENKASANNQSPGYIEGATYDEHRNAVLALTPADQEAWRCGEIGEKVTGAAADAHKWKLDITYCPDGQDFCCDDAPGSTGDGSQNHQPHSTRVKGICHSEKDDIRCKSVSEGNHSSNWRWHYRWSNFGACNLRKHKFQQRRMWWLLYSAYKNFKAYYNCMGPWRADGYRTNGAGQDVVQRDDDQTDDAAEVGSASGMITAPGQPDIQTSQLTAPGETTATLPTP